MAEQKQEKNSQPQEIRHAPFVSTQEEVHAQIDIDSGAAFEPPAGTATKQEPVQRHPDVKAEKNASKASGDADQTDNRQIINPKNNSSNQYR